MRDLINILEERLRLGPGLRLGLSRDELMELAEAIAMDEEENPIYKKAEEAVTRKVGQKAWLSLVGWLERSYYDKDTEWIAMSLEKLPIDRINRLLGGGSDAIVLELDEDWVIRWSHNGGPLGNERKFYEYCLRHPEIKCLPRIKKIGRSFVVEERLETLTPKCRRYDDLMFNRIYYLPEKDVHAKLWEVFAYDGGSLKDSGRAGQRDWRGARRELLGIMIKEGGEEVWRWADIMDKALAKMGLYGFPADIRLANIGERERTGEIVAFDV